VHNAGNLAATTSMYGVEVNHVRRKAAPVNMHPGAWWCQILPEFQFTLNHC
jgi:hypothetical protein